jgi:hypothetical protein
VPDLHTLLVPIHYQLGAMKCGAIGLSIIRPALGHSVDEEPDVGRRSRMWSPRRLLPATTTGDTFRAAPFDWSPSA